MTLAPSHDGAVASNREPARGSPSLASIALRARVTIVLDVLSRAGAVLVEALGCAAVHAVLAAVLDEASGTHGCGLLRSWKGCTMYRV